MKVSFVGVFHLNFQEIWTIPGITLKVYFRICGFSISWAETDFIPAAVNVSNYHIGSSKVELWYPKHF